MGDAEGIPTPPFREKVKIDSSFPPEKCLVLRTPLNVVHLFGLWQVRVPCHFCFGSFHINMVLTWAGKTGKMGNH